MALRPTWPCSEVTLSPYLRVIVAIISFLETMLLIYLSYKVSAPWPGPAPIDPATDTLHQPSSSP